MTLESGTRLGHYRITEPLGKGGMGEVYRARDTKLNRDVALKILPEAFANDSRRMGRFQREAQVLASLNHPNIGAIFGLEDSTETKALVLEIIEGPTLAERIKQGPIPVEEALKIALQIAEALEAAHEKGIIHRDLKPANVKITPEGTVKVLDFGLAKATEEESQQPSDLTASPTLSLAATKAGVILGTAAYMSPEQARGKIVDKRTDIWAFAVLHFEMLAGQRPFEGEDVSEILASIIKMDPKFDLLPASTPPPLRRLLRRSLEKDRRNRLADISDARLEIQEALQGPEHELSVPPPVASSSARRQAIYTVITVALTMLLTTLFWNLARSSVDRSVDLTRFAIGAPEMLTADPLVAADIVISPDGRKIVYVGSKAGGGNQLYVRPIDELTATPLRGGEGAQPFISPDSRWVGFVAGRQTIMKVPIGGGSPQTLATIPVQRVLGGTWVRDDLIIVGSSEGLYKVPADGGNPDALTVIDTAMLSDGQQVRHVHPNWVPGSNIVLFVSSPYGKGRMITSKLAAVDVQSREITELALVGTSPHYVPTGHIVFASRERLTEPSTLVAVAFDVDRREPAGSVVALVEGVITTDGQTAGFSLSNEGTLVYRFGSDTRSMVWVDRLGQEEALAIPPGSYLYSRISPDGTRAALTSRDDEEDVWIWDFARENLLRLTTDPNLDIYSIWTADSRNILFSSDRAGNLGIYRRAADGSGPVEALFAPEGQDVVPNALSPDGKQLVIRGGMAAAWDLFVTALENDSAPSALLTSDATTQLNGEISPDGRWLAYQSDESGNVEVYIRPFPDVQSGRWKISTAGGRTPAWSRNGRELFYAAPKGFMAVPIETGPSLSAGRPEFLFEGPYLLSGPGRNYDVSSDGQRFLMIKRESRSEQLDGPPKVVVVMNWFEELKTRVQPRR